MCFSATANFAGSAVLGAIGIATLREVEHRREFLFAALPSCFALHQFSEGFVWLGLDGRLSSTVTQDAAAAFILYAQGLLPFLIPFAVLLLEPLGTRRKRMLPFLVLGTALTLYTLWALIAKPLQVFVEHRSIVYQNPATAHGLLAVLYIIATCGALFFSGFRYILWFGALNLAGLIVVFLVKSYAFTSVWCAYAAVMSIIIYFFFRSRRRRHPAYTKGEALAGI